MILANPFALFWLLLAAPIVWLWLHRAAPPCALVATDAIWQEALSAEQFRAKWQRWRRPASLAIRLLALVSIVLALADPRTRPPQRFVLVLDNSASMNTADVAPARLAAAKEATRQIIDSLHDDDMAAVVTAGSPAAVRCSLTADKRMLRAATEDTPAALGAAEMTAAIDLAQRLSPEGRGNRIVVLSDGCFPAAADIARREGILLLSFGTRAGNVAITRLAARSCKTAVPAVLHETAGQKPALCQVLMEVRSFCDRAVTCRVSIESKEETIELPADGRWQDVWEMPSPAGGRITARLASADVSVADNEVSAEVVDRASPGRKPEDTASRNDSSPGLGPGLALQELDLRVPDGLDHNLASSGISPAGPPIWLFLLVAGGLLIGAEWCLVQQRWLD